MPVDPRDVAIGHERHVHARRLGRRHATAHFSGTLHPIIRSYEPGELWWYCYIDDLAFLVEAAPPFAQTTRTSLAVAPTAEQRREALWP